METPNLDRILENRTGRDCDDPEAVAARAELTALRQRAETAEAALRDRDSTINVIGFLVGRQGEAATLALVRMAQESMGAARAASHESDGETRSTLTETFDAQQEARVREIARAEDSLLGNPILKRLADHHNEIVRLEKRIDALANVAREDAIRLNVHAERFQEINDKMHAHEENCLAASDVLPRLAKLEASASASGAHYAECIEPGCAWRGALDQLGTHIREWHANEHTPPSGSSAGTTP